MNLAGKANYSRFGVVTSLVMALSMLIFRDLPLRPCQPKSGSQASYQSRTASNSLGIGHSELGKESNRALEYPLDENSAAMRSE